jgi:hypothetical protein
MVAGVAVLVCAAALAMHAGELTNVEFLHKHFVCVVHGTTNYVGTKSPEKTRMVSITFAADRPTADKDKLFARDFVLRYKHKDGTEDRAGCDLIGLVPGDYQDFFVSGWQGGTEPRIDVEGKHVRVGLAFFIENDVTKAELWRIGTDQPLEVSLGTDRPFSVYVCTQKDKAKAKSLKRTIEDKVDNVEALADTGLANCDKPTVLYDKHVPDDVRDAVIAALEKAVGGTVTRKEIGEEMVTDFDMLLWVPD